MGFTKPHTLSVGGFEPSQSEGISIFKNVFVQILKIFPQIVSAETILFEFGLMYCIQRSQYIKVTKLFTIQGRKLFAEIRYTFTPNKYILLEVLGSSIYLVCKFKKWPISEILGPNLDLS